MFDYIKTIKGTKYVHYLLGDMIVSLGNLPSVEARAVLFALEQRLDPLVVSELLWEDLAGADITDLGIEILAVQSRHPQSALVFWTGEGAMPLVDLENKAQLAFDGKSWSAIRGLYERMVWVDPEADVQEFIKHFRA